MKTNLTVEEALLLVDVLREYLTELHSEIRDTDDHDFKEGLKRKEQTLNAIVGRFELELAAV